MTRAETGFPGNKEKAKLRVNYSASSRTLDIFFLAAIKAGLRPPGGIFRAQRNFSFSFSLLLLDSFQDKEKFRSAWVTVDRGEFLGKQYGAINI